MKKSNIVIVILVIAAAGFFLWVLSRSNSQPPQTSASSGSANNAIAISFAFNPIDSSDGWAEVEVLPLTFASSEWSFGIALNAHQEIDADLIKTVTLTDDRGDTLTPLRWDEPNSGGHHRKGILVFPSPSSTPKKITIIMTGVGGAATRTFSWNLW